MSIEFNWDKLTEDAPQIEQQICDFLNEQFLNIKLPEFISSLTVSSFTLGTSPPEITLKHFSDPFPEFYEQDAELDEIELSQIEQSASEFEVSEDIELDNTVLIDDSSSLNYRLVDDASEENNEEEGLNKNPFDVQSYVELKYDGDMKICVNAKVAVNYPAPAFISLPVKIVVSKLNIHALLVAAVIKNRVHLTIMSDVHNKDVVPSEEVDVIKGMKIESEIGDHTDNGALLKNVGKAEKFVIEQLRNVIRDELVWPGWLTLEL